MATRCAAPTRNRDTARNTSKATLLYSLAGPEHMPGKAAIADGYLFALMLVKYAEARLLGSKFFFCSTVRCKDKFFSTYFSRNSRNS